MVLARQTVAKQSLSTAKMWMRPSTKKIRQLNGFNALCS